MTTKNAAEKIGDDLRPEYDLSKLTGAVRGKYYKRATASTALVLLEPDVPEAFPDGRTVNDVLRAIAKVARTQAEAIGGGRPNKPNAADALRGKAASRSLGSQKTLASARLIGKRVSATLRVQYSRSEKWQEVHKS